MSRYLKIVFLMTLALSISSQVFAQGSAPEPDIKVSGYFLDSLVYIPETSGWDGYVLDLVLEGNSPSGRIVAVFEPDEFVGDVARGRPYQEVGGAFVETDTGMAYPVDFGWTGYITPSVEGSFSLGGSPSDVIESGSPFGTLTVSPLNRERLTFSLAPGVKVRGLSTLFGDFGIAAFFRLPSGMKPITVSLPGQDPIHLESLQDTYSNQTGIQNQLNTVSGLTLSEALSVFPAGISLNQVPNYPTVSNLNIILQLHNVDTLGDQPLPELRGSLVDKWGMMQILWVAPTNMFKLPGAVGPGQTATGNIEIPLTSVQAETVVNNWWYLSLTTGYGGQDFQPTSVGVLRISA